jgi:hypothetical protein
MMRTSGASDYASEGQGHKKLGLSVGSFRGFATSSAAGGDILSPWTQRDPVAWPGRIKSSVRGGPIVHSLPLADLRPKSNPMIDKAFHKAI